MSHKKFGPDRFSRFDVYWIQTDRQTDKPNLYIEDSIPLYIEDSIPLCMEDSIPLCMEDSIPLYIED